MYYNDKVMCILFIMSPLLASVTASITTSGTNTAGETYNLVCSVTVTGSNDQLTITWLNGGSEITSNSSRTASATTGDGSNGHSSTLTFNPLSVSQAGTYMCTAMADNTTHTAMEEVIVRGKCL